MSKQIDFTGLKKALSSDPNVAVAYLLGSYARGEPRSISDVDIGIVLKDASVLEKDYLKTHVHYYNLLSPFVEYHPKQREIDLVFLQKAPVPLQLEAISEGKALYSADALTRINFEEQVGRRYADLKPHLDELTYENLEVMAHAH